MEFSNGEFQPVAEGSYVAVCQPEGVNIGLVAGSEQAVLIDAGSTPEQGASLLTAARDLSPVPVTSVILTHDHYDHWFGAAGMTDVEIIAHENLGQPTGTTEQVRHQLGIDAPQPTTTFAIAKALNLGDLRLELLHLGRAHTNCDVLIWIPGRGVAFVGDLLESSGDPQFGPESDLKNWPLALDGILGAATPETKFVPGHGPVVDREFAFRQRAEIGMIHAQTEWLIKQGVGLNEALARDDWPFSPATLQVVLPLAYESFSAQGVVPRTQLPLA